MVCVGAVTGFGASALHGIFISGAGAGDLLSQLLSRTSVHESWHAEIVDAKGEVIDDAVCLRWTSSEEAYLLTTHGNRLIQDRVVDRCIELGAHFRSADEPIFGSGTHDPVNRIVRDAMRLLPAAPSSEVCAFLLVQSSAAGFAGEAEGWKTASPSLERVEELLSHAVTGVQMICPPTVVFTGVTNAGKSTLFNRLVGEERSIVTSIEGTTRDLVKAPAQIEGWPLILVDGAGTRETDDPVESEGLRRLAGEMTRADLVLELILPGQPARENGTESRTLVVRSRCDEWTEDDPSPAGEAIRVSAVTGEGIGDLQMAMLDLLHGGRKFDPNQPCPFLAEHVIFLQQLRECLLADSGVGEVISGFMEGAGDCLQ